MKVLSKISVAVIAAVCLAGSFAQAASFGNERLLGTVAPGTPSDEGNELNRLNFLIDKYNDGVVNGTTFSSVPGDSGPETATLYRPASAPAVLVDANVGGGQVSGSNAGTQSIDFGAGYLYLLVKWGNDDAFYYVGGLTGLYDAQNGIILNSGNGNPLGASHYTLYNPAGNNVPDGGSTLALIGLAAVGLGFLRRKLS